MSNNKKARIETNIDKILSREHDKNIDLYSLESQRELNFWGRSIHINEVKKKTIYSILFINICAFDLIYNSPSINEAIVILAQLTGRNASLYNPSPTEAFADQQKMQREFIFNTGATPQLANANAARFYQFGLEEQIEIDGESYSLRNWINLILNNNVPQPFRIHFSIIFNIVEIIYKTFGSYDTIVSGLKHSTEQIATDPNGPLMGIVNELINSMKSGMFAQLGELTGTQLLVLAVLSTTFISTSAYNPLLNSIRLGTKLTLIGIDSIVDYIALIFLSDEALHSLVLPGIEEENSEVNLSDWSSNVTQEINLANKSANNSVSSYGELNGPIELTNRLLCLSGSMVIATAAVADESVRSLVIGFRQFYDGLFTKRESLEDEFESVRSETDSFGSYKTTEGGLDDVSVYTFLTESNNDSFNKFISETNTNLQRKSEEVIKATNNKKKLLDNTLNLISIIAANSLVSSCGDRSVSELSYQTSRSVTSMSNISDITGSTFNVGRNINRCSSVSEKSERIVVSAFRDIILKGGINNDNDKAATSIKEELKDNEDIEDELKIFEEYINDFETNPPNSFLERKDEDEEEYLSPLTQSPMPDYGGRRTRKNRKVSKNKTKKIKKSRKTRKRRRRFRKSNNSNKKY